MPCAGLGLEWPLQPPLRQDGTRLTYSRSVSDAGLAAPFMPWVTLCELSELTDGAAKPVDIDGHRLAVFRDGPTVATLDNACPHAGVALGGGHVDAGCAVCPAHLWAFDLATGQLRGTPGVSVRRYPTRLFDFAGKRFVQADLPST